MKNIEITGFTPDYRNGFLNVLTAIGHPDNTRTYQVPFMAIARGYYPEGGGKIIMMQLHKHENGEVEIYEFPMTPAGFISEMLSNIQEQKLSFKERAPYVSKFEELITTLISMGL